MTLHRLWIPPLIVAMGTEVDMKKKIEESDADGDRENLHQKRNPVWRRFLRGNNKGQEKRTKHHLVQRAKKSNVILVGGQQFTAPSNDSQPHNTSAPDNKSTNQPIAPSVCGLTQSPTSSQVIEHWQYLSCCQFIYRSIYSSLFKCDLIHPPTQSNFVYNSDHSLSFSSFSSTPECTYENGGEDEAEGMKVILLWHIHTCTYTQLCKCVNM